MNDLIERLWDPQSPQYQEVNYSVVILELRDGAAMQADDVAFVRGRLSFERPDGTKGAPAPAPSVVLVYDGKNAGKKAEPTFCSLEV